jgi:hypothetical protein
MTTFHGVAPVWREQPSAGSGRLFVAILPLHTPPRVFLVTSTCKGRLVTCYTVVERSRKGIERLHGLWSSLNCV